MKTYFLPLAILSLLTLSVWDASEAAAQRGGRGRGGDSEERGGGRGGGRGGDFGGRGGGRGGFGGGPAAMLGRFDRNGNGVLEPGEAPEQAAGFIRRMAERAGLDPNRPIRIEQLANSSGRGGGEDDSRGRGRGGRDDDDDDRRRRRRDNDDDQGGYTPEGAALVPGFDVLPTLALVPGFDIPLSVTNADGPTDEELEKMYGDDISRFAARILDRFDRDKNGVLGPAEWESVPFRSDPNAGDTDRDGHLTKGELIVYMAKERGVEPKPLYAIAGTDDSSDSAGTRREERRSPAEPSKPRPAVTKDQRIVKYAQGLIKKYDKNQDGKLQGDELKELKGSPSQADADGDGTITEDELVEKLGGNKPAESAGSSRGSRSGRGGGRLPSWFSSRDDDQDGQIAMSEYSSSWDARRVREFQRYDKNGDGVISRAEAGGG